MCLTFRSLCHSFPLEVWASQIQCQLSKSCTFCQWLRRCWNIQKVKLFNVLVAYFSSNDKFMWPFYWIFATVLFSYIFEYDKKTNSYYNSDIPRVKFFSAFMNLNFAILRKCDRSEPFRENREKPQIFSTNLKPICRYFGHTENIMIHEYVITDLNQWCWSYFSFFFNFLVVFVFIAVHDRMWQSQ